jgi:ankyrin repeat protein
MSSSSSVHRLLPLVRVFRRTLIRNVNDLPCDVVLHRMPVPEATPLFSESTRFPDAQGNSKLHLACLHERTDLIRGLIDGADVNAKNAMGMTPLHVVALQSMFQQTESAKMAELLLDHGADVNAADNRRHTPLHIACGAPSAGPFVRLLLERGALVNARSETLATPLVRASRNGVRAFAELLLTRSDLDVNAAQNDGLTSLHFCAFFDHVAFLRTLLASGRCHLDVEATAAARTALQVAVARGSARVARELINAGASRHGIGEQLLENVVRRADDTPKKPVLPMAWHDGFL